MNAWDSLSSDEVRDRLRAVEAEVPTLPAGPQRAGPLTAQRTQEQCPSDGLVALLRVAPATIIA